MDSIAHSFTGENDFLNKERFEIRFKEGYEKGWKEVQKEVAKNLLAAKNISIADIAKYVGVTEAFVKQIKNRL